MLEICSVEPHGPIGVWPLWMWQSGNGTDPDPNYVYLAQGLVAEGYVKVKLGIDKQLSVDNLSHSDVLRAQRFAQDTGLGMWKK